MPQDLRLISTLDRLAGRALHGLWAALCLAVAFLWLGQENMNLIAILGVGAVALPGILGLVLAGRRQIADPMVRFILVIAWSFPPLLAGAIHGGVISPAALVFLAGPVALTASARPRHAIIGWVSGGLTFALFAASAAMFGPPAILVSMDPAVFALLSAFLFVGVAVGILRLSIRLGRARQEIAHLRPQAEGFANSPSPLVITDTSGHVLAASKSLRRLVPGAPRDMTGLPLQGFAFDEKGAEKVVQGVNAALDGGGDRGGRFQFSVRDNRGEAVDLCGEGRLVSAGLVVELNAPSENDLTEQLRRERDDAIAASQSKSEFLAAISHEIRTPLNAIIGFSDVMKQRLFGPMPARYAEYGELIHESGVFLLELIGDVLDMSKIEAERYELDITEFDLNDIVRTSLKMMSLRAEDKSIALTSDVNEKPLTVKADRKALRQILLNLLSNAVKFTPEGGAIAVMARAEGQNLILAVGDSGVGMSPEEVSHLGEAFVQTRSGKDTLERGSGLGLSLVRSIARLHDGEMRVESTQGEGTTVIVTLPVLAEARGEVETLEPLEVHARIRKAQDAGEEIVRQVQAG